MDVFVQLELRTAERDTARNEVKRLERDYAALRTEYQECAAQRDRLALRVFELESQLAGKGQ